ncbi:integrase core domain-containing protein [Streptomyces sp. NPDC056653]|uniref:integrase core domain-containing protein n=1 Tax=Streptomyces sp. NPDC056653 TaxID=3345894 RepID=UPI003695CA68
MTVPEIRRLIGTLFVPLTRTLTTLLHWSTWRRHHQATARRSHCQRRLTTETLEDGFQFRAHETARRAEHFTQVSRARTGGAPSVPVEAFDGSALGAGTVGGGMLDPAGLAQGLALGGPAAGAEDPAATGARLWLVATVSAKRPWRSLSQVERAAAEWTDWYNHTRRHGEIGHIPPAEYEANHYLTTTKPQATTTI